MQNIQNPPPLQIARWCLTNSIVPLPIEGKRPTVNDWPNFRPTAEQLPEYFNGQQQNIGALLGPASHGLVDVDLDWREAELVAPTFLPNSWKFGRVDDVLGFHIRHVLLRCPDVTNRDWKAPAKVFSKPLSIVQILAAGKQVVMPGSIHEGTGQEIVWYQKPAPDLLKTIDQANLVQRVNRLAGTALLGRLWADLEGSRHDVALALAGACHHAGWSFEEIGAMGMALLDCGHDEQQHDRIKAMKTTLQRAVDGQAVTGLPKLAELLPHEVTACLESWFGLGADFPPLTINGQPLKDSPPAAATAAPTETARPWQKETLSLVRGDTIKPVAIRWLWKDWLAKGKLHIIAGPPGTGKTSALLSMAAAITTGGKLPDGTKAEAGHVLIWSGEDDINDTLVPRLTACRADMDKVHFVDEVDGNLGKRSFDPARDTQLLRDSIAELNVKPSLLMVDPIVSAIAGDSHKNAEVRRSLQPLVDLATVVDCVLAGITHFRKGGAGRDPLERVTGSLAFGAMARVVMAAAKLPEEEGGGRVLVRAKSNIGPDGGGFKYNLLPTELAAYPGIETSWVGWGDPIEGSAREILGQADLPSDAEDHSALEDAKAFLLELLADGPVPAKWVQRDASQNGHTKRTIDRAKALLGIRSNKEQSGWFWVLE